MKQMVLPIGWPAPVSKISQERLPTNTTTRHHPVHRWFNFIAGFSPEFVSQCISSTQASEQQVLLDPFSGCGTAQVEGLRHGMKAIGFEPHPIFFRIARAKTIAAVPDLAAIEKTIRYGFRHPCNVDELGPKPAEFLSKLIPQESLEKMVGARLALQSSAHCNSDIAFLVLSKVLDSVSHSATDGVYKAPATFKKSHDITAALESIINIIAEDCEFRGSQSQSSCKLVNSSSESMTLVRSQLC